MGRKLMPCDRFLFCFVSIYRIFHGVNKDIICGEFKFLLLFLWLQIAMYTWERSFQVEVYHYPINAYCKVHNIFLHTMSSYWTKFNFQAIRVIANLSINAEAGAGIAANEALVDLLIQILGEFTQWRKGITFNHANPFFIRCLSIGLSLTFFGSLQM